MKVIVSFIKNTILMTGLILTAFFLTPARHKLAHTAHQNHNHVIHLNDTFKETVLENEKPVIVSFSAPWCPSCSAMEPIMQDLADTPEFKNDLAFVTVDIDVFKEQADDYGIDRLPTFVFFKNGRPQATHPGGMSKQELTHEIKKFLVS